MWKPVLEGTANEDAVRIIKEIAEEIRDPQKPWADTDDASFAGGLSGYALFYAYLEESIPGEGYGETAVGFLEKAIDIMSSQSLFPGLYSGAPGIAWTTVHVGAVDPEDNEENPLRKIDENILEYTKNSPWKWDYDLISGLVGIGVYALEALPRPTSRAILEEVVTRLSELAQEMDGGIAWATSPELLPEWQRELDPKGYYNLGLAHGIPGVWSILAQAATEGIQESTSRELLEKSISWLLDQDLPEEAGFPGWIPIGSKREEGTRYAWCYGDPGIAIALFSAARLLGNDVWEAASLKISRRIAEASPERAGVKDAGICHGSAGLGHIFNRFYQATNDEQFLGAARHWFARTLEFRQPGSGVGGYQMFAKGKLLDDAGILTGSSGIALTLLSAAYPVEPFWDRFLLTAVPDKE